MTLPIIFIVLCVLCLLVLVLSLFWDKIPLHTGHKQILGLAVAVLFFTGFIGLIGGNMWQGPPYGLLSWALLQPKSGKRIIRHYPKEPKENSLSLEE